MTLIVVAAAAGSPVATPITDVLPSATPVPVISPRPVEALMVPVDDGNATGWIALPRGEEPRTLIVFCHAFGVPSSYFHVLMEEYAAMGAASLAMDYGGPLGSFNVGAGVRDTSAAVDHVLSRYPSIERTIIYGFSMGGAVAALTVATMPPGTFDDLVIGAGVSDLADLWHEVPFFRPSIEEETGGRPDTAPQEYERRSAVASAEAIARAGLSSIILVHARADPVVPFAHATRLYAALSAHDANASFLDVAGTDPPWGCPVLNTTCQANSLAHIDSHLAGDTTHLEPLLRGVVEDTWRPQPGIRVVWAEQGARLSVLG